MGRLLVVACAGVFGVTYARVILAERAQRRPANGPQSHADAIVVFGGKCYEERPSIEVCERMNHAIALWKESAAPRILLSGGLDGTLDEVEIMRAYAIDKGVPDRALGAARPGDNSRLTISSLRPDRTYIAVSSAYHAHRIAGEARRQRRRVIVDCAPDTIEIRNPRVRRVQRVSEVVGCLVYAAPSPLAEPARRAFGRLRHDIPSLFRPR